MMVQRLGGLQFIIEKTSSNTRSTFVDASSRRAEETLPVTSFEGGAHGSSQAARAVQFPSRSASVLGRGARPAHVLIFDDIHLTD